MKYCKRKSTYKQRKKKIVTIMVELITIIAIIVAMYAYATYKSKYEGDYQTATIAKWSFKVNGQAETIGNINLADTRKPNDKVAEGTIAPGTEGQFDLEIDGSGSEVTIEYTIAIDVEEKPQNLKFYTDSEYKNEITDTNNLMNLIDVIELEDVGTPVTKTIYWKWPLETGSTEEEINKNDQIDSEDSQKDVKMNVSVTGIQKNPDEIRLAQTTIELLNPKEGLYSKGETIEIQANFNKPVYAGMSKEQITGKTAPIMTIKIGDGQEKQLTFAKVTNNENGESSIKYTYDVTEEDDGELELINYTGTVYSEKGIQLTVTKKDLSKKITVEKELKQTTIEVVNPKEGIYTAGETIEIQSNFNKQIYAGTAKEEITDQTAPVMKIKIGEGTEKALTFAGVTNNENGESSIKYTYKVAEEDDGTMQIASYTGKVYSEYGTPLTVVKKDLEDKIVMERTLEQTTIEVVNPKESAYSRGETIEIQANFNKPIYAGTAKEQITAETAPVMTIKIGNGTEKTLTFTQITNNENSTSSIKYTYMVEQEDDGTLQITSYAGKVYSAKGTALQVAKKDLAKEIKVSSKLIGQIAPTNYGENVEYSVTVNGETLDNWKIFLNDGKNVYLKYGDYLPNACVTATDLSKFRSYAVYSSSRDKLINALTTTSNWDSMLTSKLKEKGAIATGAPTLEQYVASWNGKYPSNKLYTRTGSIGYYLGTSENPSSTSVNVRYTPGYSDTLYYPHTSSWNSTFGYCLASPSAYDSECVMKVRYDGLVHVNSALSDQAFYSCAPVICLPYDILAKKDDNTGKWVLDTMSQTTIEVTNPKESTYSKGETIEIQANYSEPIYAGKSKQVITASNAPVMKIKIGEGSEKTLTFAGVTNNQNAESSIKYTYTVEQEDEGILKISDYTGKVYSAKGVSLAVTKKDLEKEITISNRLVNNIKATNYGDSVDYTVTVNGETLDNWKIFLNDGKNVYLKYGDYLPNKCVTSALNLSLKTSGTYGVYSTSPANLINELTTSGWGNFLTKALKVRGATATGAPTLEQYVESWNGKYPSDKLYIAKNSTGYYIGTSENPTTTSKSMSSTTGYSDTLYYPHKASWNSAHGYWLASPSAQSSSYVMDIYYDGDIYRNKYNATQLAACPVICLPPGMIGEKDSSSGKWVLNTGLKLGDIINYNPSGTYDWDKSYATSDQVGKETLSSKSGGSFNVSKWKVLSIDEATGTVEMVPATIASGTVRLQGGQGYNNAVYLLNEACSKLYGNEEKGIKARSIKEEDFVKAGGTKWIEARAAYRSATEYGTQYPLAYTSSKEYPTMYKKENNSVIDGNKKTDGYSQSEQDALIGRTEESATRGYLTADTSIQPYQTYYNTSNYTETAKLLGDYAEILLPNKSYTKYWVASRCVCLYTDFCNFHVCGIDSGYLYGCGVGGSGDGESNDSRALCPIVSLSSQVLEKAEDGTYNVK